MTRPHRWPSAVRRSLAVLVGCAVAVGLAGCANDRDKRMAQLERGRTADPLLGEKIPPPNVPTGREQYGAKDGRDPLLRADARGGFDPFSRDGSNEPLRIPDRRPTGTAPGRELTLGSSATADQMTAELQQIGAKVYPPSRPETGSYDVRVMIPNTSGAMSGYVGGGPTPTAALRDAYDQVRSGGR